MGRPHGRPLMRYLLDTNILSNVIKPAPSESLLAWMSERADTELFIASLTLAEIQRGILEKSAGKKRRDLSRGSRGRKVRKLSSSIASSCLTKMPAPSGRG